jgi:acetyl-CoA/propionyl-CoA carboxylase biotin carboxyl carrier protein
MVTGVDLVREQVRIAAGEPMSVTQDEIRPRGHAFECRINAEDATKRFLPSPARIGAYREPTGPGVRVDSGVRAGSEIPEIYDPMVAKLVVWDVDREHARRRMIRALEEYVVEGPATLIPFHLWLFREQEFIDNGALHAQLNAMSDTATPLPAPEAPAPVLPADTADEPEEEVVRTFTAEVDGRRYGVRLSFPASQAGLGGGGGGAAAPAKRRIAKRGGGGASKGHAAAESVVTPMQGTVLRVLVEEGQEVAMGDVICIVEAMKMENEIAAHRDGVVSGLSVTSGQPVTAGQVICIVVKDGEIADGAGG